MRPVDSTRPHGRVVDDVDVVVHVYVNVAGDIADADNDRDERNGEYVWLARRMRMPMRM